MKKLILCSLFCWLFSSIYAAQVDTLSIRSERMKKKIKTVLIVPDVANTRACPTVYLLHGFGGNYKTWLQIKPDLPQIADEMGCIFVCPDGAGSWYWDSPRNPDMQYETFISSELVRFIDTRCNTIKERTGRAITGLSMGGHGAMYLAINHLETFSIEIRTECDNASIFLGISLEAFKTCLCILKNACTFRHGDGIILCELSFFPCTIFPFCIVTVICGHVTESKLTPFNILLFHNAPLRRKI